MKTFLLLFYWWNHDFFKHTSATFETCNRAADCFTFTWTSPFRRLGILSRMRASNRSAPCSSYISHCSIFSTFLDCDEHRVKTFSVCSVSWWATMWCIWSKSKYHKSFEDDCWRTRLNFSTALWLHQMLFWSVISLLFHFFQNGVHCDVDSSAVNLYLVTWRELTWPNNLLAPCTLPVVYNGLHSVLNMPTLCSYRK